MFRKTIFWAHLVAGVISGLSIGIMCFTGTALAFEKEIIAWAERDARRIEPPVSDVTKLSLDELQRRLREAQPDARPINLVVQNDPRVAVAFSAGRVGNFYANPYTGEIAQPKSSRVGNFMQTMLTWHRYLGLSGEQSRPRGKLINGICNVAFCVLALTGLYLWMPRSWSLRALRPGVWFTQNSTSKARDWNWHNVIGFWCAPVLIVLTLTAMPISFRWAGDFIFTLTGTPKPATTAGGPAAASVPPIEVSPAAGARLSHDALLAIAQREVPRWKTITLRINAPSGTRGSDRPATRGSSDPADRSARSDNERETRTAPRAPQAVTFTIRETDSWPRTATTTLSLHPVTGEILRRTGYSDQNAAQRVRAWTRFLHTGEAIGWPGQIIAGLASLGGCFLVYTGFALSWRRFFGKKTPVAG